MSSLQSVTLSLTDSFSRIRVQFNVILISFSSLNMNIDRQTRQLGPLAVGLIFLLSIVYCVKPLESKNFDEMIFDMFTTM